MLDLHRYTHIHSVRTEQGSLVHEEHTQLTRYQLGAC